MWRMSIRRRYWVTAVIAVLGLVVTTLVALALRIPFSSEPVRQNVYEPLSHQLDAQAELPVQQVGIAEKMPFHSLITNAVPPGRIPTSGTFGPWAVEDPGQTPLDGDFTLDAADLGVFRGISGILSARGAYAGVLERIDV